MVFSCWSNTFYGMAVMKRNRFLLYAISLFQGMVFYSSIATLYRQAAGLSIFQITLIESVSMVLSLAFEIPWGVLADRVGYTRTMIACNILFFVSKIVFWQSRDFAGFLLERVLLAVVVSGLSGVDTSILYLSCHEGDSQRAFGIYQALGAVGLLFAAAVFTVSVGENYRTTGFLTVISYGAAAALSFGLRGGGKTPAKEEKNVTGTFLSYPERNAFEPKPALSGGRRGASAGGGSNHYGIFGSASIHQGGDDGQDDLRGLYSGHHFRIGRLVFRVSHKKAEAAIFRGDAFWDLRVFLPEFSSYRKSVCFGFWRFADPGLFQPVIPAGYRAAKQDHHNRRPRDCP